MIIAAVAGAWLGFWDIPIITPKGPVDMLVIGAPSFETLEVLDNSKDLIQYRIVGDVDFQSVKSKALYITPVPNGVGPMTIAMLIENVVEAANRQKEK